MWFLWCGKVRTLRFFFLPGCAQPFHLHTKEEKQGCLCLPGLPPSVGQPSLLSLLPLLRLDLFLIDISALEVDDFNLQNQSGQVGSRYLQRQTGGNDEREADVGVCSS